MRLLEIIRSTETVGYLTRQGSRKTFYNRDPAYAAICDKLYGLGRFGQKSGRGFYRYEGRNKTEDPEVMELAAQLAKENNVINHSSVRSLILFLCA